MTVRRVVVLVLLFLLASAAFAAPGGFTLINGRRVCTNGQTASIAFDWTASSGATSYDVVRDGATIATLPASTFTFDDPNVSPAQTYTYVVMARDGSGGVTQSANSVTTTAPYCQPPDPPVLTATLICQSAQGVVQLDWTSSPRAETYDVYRNGIRIRTNLPATTTSMVDTQVTVGTVYSYFVRAMNVGTITPPPPPPTTSSDSNTATVTASNPCPAPPAAPTVSASPFCGTAAGLPLAKVSVTWTAPAGATSYSVFRNDQFLQSTTSTSYEDNTGGVSPGGTYTYKVYASGAGGQGAPGSTTITVPNNVCSPPPSAPTSVQATSICSPSDAPAVQVSWNAAANATSYTLLRNGATLFSGLTSTTFIDNTAAVGTTYTYVVRAVNDGGSADSSPATITHTDVCPRAPGAFTSSVSVFCASGAPGVRVTWTASSGASTYAVLRNGATLASGLTGTSYDDTSVTDGATYTYVVRATNNKGSTDTAPDSVTVVDPCPRPPGAFTLSGNSFCAGASPAVHLSWTAALRAVNYSVVRNGTVLATNVTGTTFDDMNVTAGTTYSYVVRALNANGSTESNPLTITPGPCNVDVPRPDLTVSNVTLSRAPADVGDAVEVSFTVTNEGAGAAGETRLRVRVGGTTSPSSSDTLVFEAGLQPLAAGASRQQTLTFNVPSVASGTYYVFVSVNEDRSVDETTFANNISAGSRLDVTRPKCRVSCLVSAPLRAVVGHSVRFALLEPSSCSITVAWQFGNSTLSGGESAMATYNAPGTYNWLVTVTASDGESCANAGTIEVTAAPTGNPRRRAVRH
jgi:fibronectin type 3 domain-containing protein